MMSLTRKAIEILLDEPDKKDYVVSAYADLTVKDGFHDFVDLNLRNVARAAGAALSEAEARKALDANVEAIREAARQVDSSARGAAIFSSVGRGLRHVVPLGFPVENRLIVDEEPYVLPLLERWYGEPVYLVALVDSAEVHLFEAHAGAVEPVGDLERPDVDQAIQRDKPRFTYKKRFAQTRHERLHAIEEDKFLQDVAALVEEHWRGGRFNGLILLGQAQITGALLRLLHKDVQGAVVEQAAQSMTTRADEVADDVSRVLERWHADSDDRALVELRERWKEHHLIANGPTDVLDALQQGRAARVIFGTRRDLAGARCVECGYRFGAPVATCVYCQGRCSSINAVQEILRMALRHRVPMHLFRPNNGNVPDPLDQAGGVSAILRAEANWAPDASTAKASEGH